MSKSNNSPKINAIFDYYETAVKNTQNIFKAMKEHGEYIDSNDGNPVVKSSEGMLAVVHVIDRVSFIPPTTGEKQFFLSGAHVNKDGWAVHTSNCHGGVMKRCKYIKRMIHEFNKKMTCDGLKIKAVLTQDGNVIPINYRKDYYTNRNC